MKVSVIQKAYFVFRIDLMEELEEVFSREEVELENIERFRVNEGVPVEWMQ